MGIGPTSYTVTIWGADGYVQKETLHRVNLFGADADSVGVAGAAARIMLKASRSWQDTHLHKGHIGIDPDPDLIDRMVSVSGAMDIALGVVDEGPIPMALTTFDKAPAAVIVPGDFRRPKWARTTHALADDELWAVNQLALGHGVTGPQMMAILLELTGARRTAYHPDGFYGISNLSSALLEHWLTVDQFTPAFSGQVGDIGSVEEFLAASVHRQLVVTDMCLRANLGGQSGVIPVFLLLATGAVPANAGPPTSIPAPLPARLQPLSINGTTLTGADIAARIADRTALLEYEFGIRMPVLCAPPPGSTRLMPTEALYAGQALPSPNGQFGLTYQSDGNLVLYRTGGVAVWASGTAGTSTGYASMQGDGNLVVYDQSSRPVWASHTDKHPGAWLAVQDGGFVTVVSPDGGTQLWRS